MNSDDCVFIGVNFIIVDFIDSPLRKHAYIILTPFNPNFYVVKLGFTGVYIIFLISAQKTLIVDTRQNHFGEPVLTSTHNLCFEQKYEKMSEFLSENFQFLVVKFSIYLNSVFS